MGFRMNPQDELFHEDWRDALRHLVKALGGYETVGADLYPTKTRKAAGNWLSDCLNPERPAKLDLEDIEALIRMGRDEGIHCAMYQLADATSYQRPKAAAPKSPLTILYERKARLAAEEAALQRDIDRALAESELRAVK